MDELLKVLQLLAFTKNKIINLKTFLPSDNILPLYENGYIWDRNLKLSSSRLECSVCVHMA